MNLVFLHASSIISVPPWDSIMEWLIDNPNPVPLPTSLVVKKGCKILSRFSIGIPRPLSVTEISISECLILASILTHLC